MEKKQFKQITEFLKDREEDKYYLKYSKLQIDSKLEGVIIKQLNSYYWKKHFDIGYYKHQHKEGGTLSDFIRNIVIHIGGAKIFNEKVEVFANYIKGICKEFSKDDIKRHTYYRMFYKNYIGFLFEDLLLEFLRSEGFEIIQNEELDNKYKIDLLLKHKGYEGAIGIQCKNISYLNVKKSIRDNHTAQHNKAIEEEVCNEVIFVLYGKDFNIFSECGVATNEGKLVEIIKNKLNFGNKKILNVGRQ